MPSATEPLALGIVQPWDCDVMGHFTVRRYAAAFDDASYQLLFAMSGTSPVAGDALGWVDVEQTYSYHEEMRPGTLFAITGAPVRLGTKSVDVEYAMRRRGDDLLIATMRSTLVRFDLIARKAVPIEDAMRGRIETMIAPSAAAGG